MLLTLALPPHKRTTHPAHATHASMSLTPLTLAQIARHSSNFLTLYYRVKDVYVTSQKCTLEAFNDKKFNKNFLIGMIYYKHFIFHFVSSNVSFYTPMKCFKSYLALFFSFTDAFCLGSYWIVNGLCRF